MPLLKPLLTTVAMLCVTAFTDVSNSLTIEFPSGWSAPTVDAGGSAESRGPDGSAWCRANVVQLESLKKLSQADINASFIQPFDKKTWAEFYSIDVANLEVADGSARVVNGRNVQKVTITIAPSVMGQEIKMRGVAHLQPAHIVNAACFARSDSFESYRGLFETVITSLKPLD